MGASLIVLHHAMRAGGLEGANHGISPIVRFVSDVPAARGGDLLGVALALAGRESIE